MAELPRGGLALFSPLAGGVNDGGLPELAVPPGGAACGPSPPLSGDVDPGALPVPDWPPATSVPPAEAPGALPVPAGASAFAWRPPRAGRGAIDDAWEPAPRSSAAG
ncbi:MAG: hypothetical protein AABM66_13615, partial [Actinomycetota bacterium]